MTIEELQIIMIEKGVSIRAIPKVVHEVWTLPSYREKDLKNIKGVIICKGDSQFGGKQYFQKITKYPKLGGKFIIVSNCNTSAQVMFSNNAFDTIEEAIKSL